MTAFDTDVLSDIIRGNARVIARLGQVDPADRAVPAVAAGEVLRGWLAVVRQAEAGKGKTTLGQAYANLTLSIEAMARFRLLPYTPTADALYQQWRAAKLRVGSQDLRIAATCLDHEATLVTRNARDYAQVPGLTLGVWN